MICPECGWWDSWEDSRSPYCEFCGALHTATEEDPQEAHDAIEDANVVEPPEESPDMDAKYEKEDGKIVTRRQIFSQILHEVTDVQPVEGGILVDGEFYRRISEE